MSEAQVQGVRQAVAVALRVLTERAALCRGLAQTQRKRGRMAAAEHWEGATREAEQRAEVLRRFIEGDQRDNGEHQTGTG